MGWGDVAGAAGVLLGLWLGWRGFRTWCAVRAGQPDFVIGADYLRRWWVLPRNRLFNIYLHNIRHDDDDRALHDHPWWNCSVVLRGGYWETVPDHRDGHQGFFQFFWRGRGSVVCRRARALHRLELHGLAQCWTLFITGPRVREWGFACPQGWVPWFEFVDPADPGKIGRGCGEGITPKPIQVKGFTAKMAPEGLTSNRWADAAEFHGGGR